MTGTTPTGIRTEQEAAAWVRGMFGRVAARYDLANHLLSCNIDRYWRAQTVRRLRPIWQNPSARVLDICCGTGDLVLALEQSRRTAVLGSDFCHPMLVAARRKLANSGKSSPLFEADALRLPLPDASLDLLTVAFGLRNLANYQAGLREIRRVLRPGGTAAILEFSQPPNRAVARLYHFYSRQILPLLGGLISGDRAAYSYLPDSVRKFPLAAELAGQMRAAGFAEVTYEYMTGGIVALHLGR
jgi:demethylmenaquinone methyltransferase / 2-methoxy-6-polyprenyl-1,4-benzoquinol methylase